MTTLLNTIKSLQLQARKEKDTWVSSLLTTLLGDLNTLQINNQRELNDDEIISVIQKFIKNNEFTLEKINDDSNVTEKYLRENKILRSFLPKQLTREEIISVISQNWYNEMAPNVPEIMQFLKRNYSGQYDGKLASTIAKEIQESDWAK